VDAIGVLLVAGAICRAWPHALRMMVTAMAIPKRPGTLFTFQLHFLTRVTPMSTDSSDLHLLSRVLA
jgi:hypothetical protein